MKETYLNAIEGLEMFAELVSCDVCPLEELCVWNKRVNKKGLCDVMLATMNELEEKIKIMDCK